MCHLIYQVPSPTLSYHFPLSPPFLITFPLIISTSNLSSLFQSLSIPLNHSHPPQKQMVCAVLSPSCFIPTTSQCSFEVLITIPTTYHQHLSFKLLLVPLSVEPSPAVLPHWFCLGRICQKTTVKHGSQGWKRANKRACSAVEMCSATCTARGHKSMAFAPKLLLCLSAWFGIRNVSNVCLGLGILGS